MKLNKIEWVAAGIIASTFFFMWGYEVGRHRIHEQRIETPAKQVRQADDSLILQRNPDTKPPELPQMPKGAKMTRITTIQVAPLDPIQPGTVASQAATTVQLTQIQTAEGSRVIASSPDGQILGGSDWTAPAGPPARVYRWQVQAVRAWDQQGRGTWGGAVGYTRGPLVGTVTILPGCIQAGVGIRW